MQPYSTLVIDMFDMPVACRAPVVLLARFSSTGAYIAMIVLIKLINLLIVYSTASSRDL